MAHAIKPLDVILFRIAGATFMSLKKSNIVSEVLKKSFVEKLRLDLKKKESAVHLCNALFLCIKTLSNDVDRKKMINFKRDIFNNRNVDFSTIENLVGLDIVKQYEKYEQLSSQILKIEESLFSTYLERMAEEYDIIQKFCVDELFLKGLQLSSQDLYILIQNNENPEDENTKLGLWKYITRMAAKTSPFSTFTNIAVTGSSINLDIDGDVKSYVRYNNYILSNIMSMIKRDNDILYKLPLKANPTIKHLPDYYSFLSNHDNIEVFQKVKKSDVIDYILFLLPTRKNININRLIKHLLKKIDCDQENLKSFLFELVALGLLEVDLAISGLDSNWEIKLIHFFKKYYANLDFDIEIIEQLKKLKKIRDRFPNESAFNRNRLLSQAIEIFDDVLLRIHINAKLPEIEREILTESSTNANDRNRLNSVSSEFKYIKNQKIDDNSVNHFFIHPLKCNYLKVFRRNILYEDTRKDVVLSYNYKHTNFIGKLDRLISTFSFVGSFDYGGVDAYNFYKEQYNNKSIDILTFYEQFYQNKFTLESQERNLDEIEDYRNAKDNLTKLHELVKAEYDNGSLKSSDGVVHITVELIEKVQNAFKDIIQPRNISYGAFVQFYDNRNDDDGLVGVVNNVFPGNGKLMGRFLHMFDANITEKVKKWNASFRPKNIVAENSDASYFNANLHPCLTNFEIRLPGGLNRHSEKTQIAVSDLRIKPDNKRRSLSIYNQEGQQVHILDLGFQSLAGRSNLYNLLCSLNDNFYFNLHAVNKIFNSFFTKGILIEGFEKDHINAYPRIIFDNSVIIQRKCWYVPIKIINELISKQDPYDAFLSLFEWKIKMDLPDEVFIKTKIEIDIKGSSDISKPQYVDFSSPLCVKLLFKMIKKVSSYLIFEEMLPESAYLTEFNQKKYVSECLLQW